MEQNDKITRMFDLYNKLQNGEIIHKPYEAIRYGVSERSIQRDIEDIRAYFEREEVDGNGITNRIVYDRREQGYRLERIQNMKLTDSESLAVCKILLDSRAFTKKKMDVILAKLIACCVPECNRSVVSHLIANEQFHYVEPQHKAEFLDILWSVAQAVSDRRYIEIRYKRLKGRKTVSRKLKPAAILFSEFYFYMAAFIDDMETRKDFEVEDDVYPTIYRIDRIARVRVLDESFPLLYRDRFEEGEFRKRIQFMFGGKLQRIKFRYSGTSVEAVLDRLPTAKILAEEGGVYTISAEVFGKGVDMWIRSQGDAVELL